MRPLRGHWVIKGLQGLQVICASDLKVKRARRDIEGWRGIEEGRINVEEQDLRFRAFPLEARDVPSSRIEDESVR